MRSPTRRKHLFWLPALALLIAIAATFPLSTRPANAQATATIGAWNIQWLGSPGSRPHYALNIAQKPEDIAAYITASKVDILGLEEISDDDNNSATITNRTLDSAFARIKTNTGQDWTYVLFPKAGGEKTQLIGLAWNKTRVIGPSEQWQIPLDFSPSSEDVWRRQPYAVKLSFGAGKTDLVVVVVHMKSNRTDPGVCEQECVKCARATEGYLLASKLDDIRARFQDDDIVILGDTNVLNGQELAIKHLTKAGLKDLNASDQKTDTEGASPLDRIFIRPNQSEFASSSLKVFKEYLQTANLTPDKFRELYSDHFLVKTTFSVGNDDD